MAGALGGSDGDVGLKFGGSARAATPNSEDLIMSVKTQSVGGSGGLDLDESPNGAGGSGAFGASGGDGGYDFSVPHHGSGGGGGSAGGGKGGKGGVEYGEQGGQTPSAPGDDAKGGGGGGGGGAGGNNAFVDTSAPSQAYTGAIGGNGGKATSEIYGLDSIGAGGGGGAGGYGVVISNLTPVTIQYAEDGGQGGDGGEGDSGGNGGDGGAGAFFVDAGSSVTFTSAGSVMGGTGGKGGILSNPGNPATDTAGSGGDGGIGVTMGDGSTVTNAGIITGGNGGAGGASNVVDVPAGQAGLGGAGLVGGNLTVINTGTIQGGVSGDTPPIQGDAIDFTGGSNTLALGAAAVITGAVNIQAGTLSFDQSKDTGFSADASLAANIIGAGAVTKTGTGTLTLSGENTYSGGTTLSGGILELASDDAAGSGAITFGQSPVTLQVDAAAVAQLPTGINLLIFAAVHSQLDNTLTNIGAGDAIDLKGLTYNTADSSKNTAVVQNNVLTVSNGFSYETFNLDSTDATSYALAGDSPNGGDADGTLVTALSSPGGGGGGGPSVGTPIANSQTTTTTQNTPDPIVLTGSDPDSPALPLTYALASQPTNGTLSNFNAATGAVTYTPNAGYAGPDSFTFTDSNGTNRSRVATVGISVSPAPTNNTPTTVAPPVVAFDPDVTAHGSTVTMTGVVSAAAGVSSLELYEGNPDDPNRVDLGSATVNADGTWSFNYDNGPGFHTNLQAVATDPLGQQTTALSYYDLTTGITGDPYRTIQDSYDPTSYAYEGSTFFKRSGTVYLQNSYSETADGGPVYDYTSGSFFHDKTYSSFIDTYDPDGNLVEHVENHRDGSHSIEADGVHQFIKGLGTDTFAANGTSTRFVLDHGVGDELITGFQVAGAGHDMVSLPNADASRLANILAHATGDGQGDTTIKIGQGDTITFAGVSVAQLQKHAGDFVFHA